ncbi:unnamed protein product [Symbiodinium pilosum]|uniref:Uncharacterized protein n=1 Tax=Symbiodinium pilosum TaxID=2952 RepID=A0A812V5S7_SYMPI|nr:unnamed protein product [Symbiodinium pilosum]
MLSLSDGKRAPVWAALAVLAAALATLALRGRQTTGAAASALCSEDLQLLLAVLKELARRFFLVCQDVAAISKSVRAKMAAGQVQIAEDTLQEQLTKQCEVFEKLQQLQAEVAKQYGLSEDRLEQLQRAAEQDPEVQSYATGFKAMLEDALQGQSPILPNVKIPEALTKKKALQIHEEAQDAEQEEALRLVQGSTVSLRKLGEFLAVAHKNAWERIFKAHASILGEHGAEVYYSVAAIYTREQDFADDKTRLEEAHQQRMIKLFQPDGNGNVTVNR